MNQDFPLNRYDFSNLVEYVRTAEELPMDITDSETGIEFYGGDTISRDELINCYSSATPNCNASSHAKSLRDGLMHLNQYTFSRTLQRSAKSFYFNIKFQYS